MRINLRYKITGDPASGIVCGADGCDTRWSGDAWINAVKALGATLIVEDPTTQTGIFQLEGMASGTAEIWSKNSSIAVTSPPKQIGTTTIQNGSFSYTLPPFSVTTFVVDAPPAGSPVASTPTATVPGTACVGDGVYVYQNSNYSGICEKFTTSIPQLRGTIVGSDTASSIKIVGNYTVTLYTDANYRGVSSVVTSNVPYLGALAVGNDAVSSLTVQLT